MGRTANKYGVPMIMIAEGVRQRKGGLGTLKGLPLRDWNEFGTFSVALAHKGFPGDSAIMWRDSSKDARGISARQIPLFHAMRGVTAVMVDKMGEPMVMRASPGRKKLSFTPLGKFEKIISFPTL